MSTEPWLDRQNQRDWEQYQLEGTWMSRPASLGPASIEAQNEYNKNRPLDNSPAMLAAIQAADTAIARDKKWLEDRKKRIASE